MIIEKQVMVGRCDEYLAGFYGLAIFGMFRRQPAGLGEDRRQHAVARDMKHDENAPREIRLQPLNDFPEWLDPPARGRPNYDDVVCHTPPFPAPAASQFTTSAYMAVWFAYNTLRPLQV